LSPQIVATPPKFANSASRSGNVAVAEVARTQKPPAKTPQPSRLTPELKGFIDRVVVPILVASYVEKLQDEKAVAECGEKANMCKLVNEAPQIEIAR
jgi:hypothetical protein